MAQAIRSTLLLGAINGRRTLWRDADMMPSDPADIRNFRSASSRSSSSRRFNTFVSSENCLLTPSRLCFSRFRFRSERALDREMAIFCADGLLELMLRSLPTLVPLVVRMRLVLSMLLLCCWLL